MKKIWFIKVDDHEEGPYNIQDLRNHPRFTPDTLVWREGFKLWTPARKVPELKSLFEDKEPSVSLHDRFKVKRVSQEDSILALEGSNFPYLFYWLLVLLLLILVYLFYRMNGI